MTQMKLTLFIMIIQVHNTKKTKKLPNLGRFYIYYITNDFMIKLL